MRYDITVGMRLEIELAWSWCDGLWRDTLDITLSEE
jgi:hypothetical protein